LKTILRALSGPLLYAPVHGQPLLEGILVNADLAAETDARQAIVAHHPVYPLRFDLERISGFFDCEYLHAGFLFHLCFAVSHSSLAMFTACSLTVLYPFFFS
jgi:hypothetical protein